VRKIIVSDDIINDLGILDPRDRHKIYSVVLMRLLKCFNKAYSAEEMDIVLTERHSLNHSLMTTYLYGHILSIFGPV